MSRPRILIGTCVCPPIGPGRLLFDLLAQQPIIDARLESRPLLEWPVLPLSSPSEVQARLVQRFERLRGKVQRDVIADVAAFYIPYLEALLAADEQLKVIHAVVPEERVVAAFEQLAQSQPLVYHHWTRRPEAPLAHDPDWTRTFPKYDIANRTEAIRRYWHDCEALVQAALKKYPQRVLRVPVESLTDSHHVVDVLKFAGVPPKQQVRRIAATTAEATPHPRLDIRDSAPDDPRRCVILVPFSTHILPETESQLRKLEDAGYTVRRQAGISAIDQGRSQMATDALIDGFQETLWIDSDIGFTVEDVSQLRRHPEAIVSGLYAKKGTRGFASHLLPGQSGMTLGKEGKLIEIQYAATGFLLVRREVYTTMQLELRLPMCNELFRGRPTIPFFQPLSIRQHDSWWSLGEDYSFSHRARECGFRVLADTSIRLWHIGNYRYGWEEAGSDAKRFDTFHMTFG